MRAWLIMMLVMMAVPCWAEDIALPSGQSVTLFDVVLEEGPPRVARLRFLAPDIDPAGAALTYAAVAPDFVYLCDSYGLPALAANDWQVDEIVISMSDREVAFGVATPEATQYFEPFTVVDGHCAQAQF